MLQYMRLGIVFVAVLVFLGCGGSSGGKGSYRIPTFGIQDVEECISNKDLFCKKGTDQRVTGEVIVYFNEDMGALSNRYKMSVSSGRLLSERYYYKSNNRVAMEIFIGKFVII